MKPRKRAVQKADTAFSRYIRARDNWTCFTCGRVGYDRDGIMQCGHLITRAKYATRWNELNAVCQCSGCNMRHEYQPEILTDMWIQENGVEYYHELVRLSNTLHKLPTSDIEQLAKEFDMLYNAIKEES